MTAQSATQSLSTSDRSSLLRMTLKGNALFSVITGVVFIVFSQWLAGFTGIPSPLGFMVVGAGLLAYAILPYQIARQDAINLRHATLIMVADELWVVASIVVLVFGLLPLTAAGKWTVGITADMVAVFAILEYIGIRRIKS